MSASEVARRLAMFLFIAPARRQRTQWTRVSSESEGDWKRSAYEPAEGDSHDEQHQRNRRDDTDDDRRDAHGTKQRATAGRGAGALEQLAVGDAPHAVGKKPRGGGRGEIPAASVPDRGTNRDDKATSDVQREPRVGRVTRPR